MKNGIKWKFLWKLGCHMLHFSKWEIYKFSGENLKKNPKINGKIWNLNLEIYLNLTEFSVGDIWQAHHSKFQNVKQNEQVKCGKKKRFQQISSKNEVKIEHLRRSWDPLEPRLRSFLIGWEN